MTLPAEQIHRILYLCGQLREEIITADEFAELNTILETSRAAQDIYLDYVYLCTDLCRLQAAVKHAPQSLDVAFEPETAAASTLTLDMLQALGEYEKEAVALDLPIEPQNAVLPVRVAPVEKMRQPISKLSLVTFVTSLAALLVLIAYVYLNPQTTFEVASLTDSLGAQWSAPMPLKQGTRIAVSRDSIHLQKGILKLETDEGVFIVIESPAEFRFTGPSEIMMQYGRLFAAVDNVENGFTVQTPTARVIDLGTEFGVYSDTRGKMELHVYKGKTALIADIENEKKVLDVTEGQARELDTVYNEIRPIQINQELFVRNIESSTGLVWHHDKYVDLADIVGGGNGAGSGSRDRALPWDGRKLLYKSELPTESSLSGRFIPVSFSPLIEGVFIPKSRGEKPLMLRSDPAALNLDEFIRQDTNGLLTLMLLHETDDIDADFWFVSKEGAGTNRAQMPALYFPRAANGPVSITTGDNRGADGYVSNDILNSPDSQLGKANGMAVRFFKDNRLRIAYVRFDISQLGGDLSGAVLNVFLGRGNRQRQLQVYGLKDGPADFWNEEALCCRTAPGLLAAAFGNYQLDEIACRPLGVFTVVDNRLAAEPVAVTADGLFTWTAPQTVDRTAYAISNTGTVTGPAALHTLQLAGLPCGTRDNPSILMHANAGMTFDLQALRQVYGPRRLKSLTAQCGISQSVLSWTPEDNLPKACFYVLVDGREVFSAVDLSPQDKPQPIEIELSDSSRYLTLVTTQGTDNSIENDLCLFVNPTIHLE